MDDLTTVLRQYQQGCERLRHRIDDLGTEITKARLQGLATKELLDRRCLLFTEMVEMQSAIRSLREYSCLQKQRSRQRRKQA